MPRKIRRYVGNGVSQHYVPSAYPVMCRIQREADLIFDFYYSFNILVSVHCKDTRIAVQVRTNKPFNGRIYALGRSETCNIDVVNSDLFRLDLTMAGQDCNTQSVVSCKFIMT